jgi:nickel/cobalt transporter (NiCoT) family protein
VRASRTLVREQEQTMLPQPFDDQPSQAKTKIITTYVLLIGGNIFAWLWAWIAFPDRPALLGMASLAYMFGLRHAFDADHIAAIDNVVRKLMQEGKTPYSVGFFFPSATPRSSSSPRSP